MNARYTLIVLLSLVLITLSCQQRQLMKEMDRIEAIMDEKPDTALLSLERIPQESLKTEKSIARYSLLKSIALDKNYIDLQSDSIISKAVDYYSVRRIGTNRMKAWYYLGRIQRNRGAYSSAIVSFERAEKDAKELYDDYYLGLINREKAIVLNTWANIHAAIECQNQAISSFTRAGKDLHTAYSKMSLAIEFFNCKEYDRSEAIINDVKSSTTNATLLLLCDLRLAAISVEKGETPVFALSIFKTIPETLFDLYDYGYYALAWERVNQPDSARVWMEKGYRIAKNQADSASLDYMNSNLALNHGDYKTAYYLLKHANEYQNKNTQSILQESLNTALKDYYKGELEKEQTVIEKESGQRKLIAIIVLLSVLAGVVFFKMQIDRKNRQLELQIAQFTAVQREKNLVQKENAELVGAIFSERMRHLNELSDEFFSADEKGKKDLVFESFKKYLMEFRNDESAFKSLEYDLNKYSDGIMNKLSAQVPKIQGDKRKIIAMFFAGVPYETIQLILRSVSIDSLRMMRTRFRKDILEANAPDAQLFLSMLYMKSGPKA